MTSHTLSARGFSAWITIDGAPVNVHQAETSDSTCSAWVPSIAGQSFSVSWKDDSDARIATSGHVFIDGHDVASAILRPGRTKPVVRAGAKTSARRLRPFRFALLRLTGRHPHVVILEAYDEALASHDDVPLGDMGTIKIEISRVKLGGEVPFKGYDAQDRGLVHESAKNPGAHCTSYGPSRRAQATRTVAVSTAPYDPNTPGTYVTFIFRYRSEDILRANGVISSGERNRHSSATGNEIFEISDCESDNNMSDGPRKKRVKTEAEKPPSDDAMAEQPYMESAPSGQPYGSDNMSGPPNTDEESQTQADDDIQMGFGTPLDLLRDDPGRVTEGDLNSGMSQTQEEGDA